MGYTHYWEFKKPGVGKQVDASEIANNNNQKEFMEKLNKSKALSMQERYDKCLDEIRLLIQLSDVELGDWDGHGEPTVEGERIAFNGLSPERCETFSLPTKVQDWEEFDFCKTRMYPYDTIVTACLAVLKDHLHDNIEVSSDGDDTDWEAGVDYASKTLGRQIANPIVYIEVGQ